MEKKEYQALLTEAEGLLLDRTNEVILERIALRDAVCAYLEAERSEGVPLEVIRQRVERILKLAEVGAARRDGSESHRKLSQQLVDWCAHPEHPPELTILS